MRQRLTTAGLGLLVVVTAVLVVLSIRQVSSTSEPTPIFDPPASLTRGLTSSPSTSAPAGSAAPQPDRRSLLGIGGDGTVVRATRGDCRKLTVPRVAISAAGGDGFAPRSVPRLREVLRVQVRSARDIRVIGLDASCTVARYRSDDGGKKWDRRPGGGSSWHLGPDGGAATVVSPAGRRTAPCVPAALSTAAGGVVRVLCRTDRIFGTDDDGRTWSPVGRLRGAVDISYVSAGQAFALAPQKGCPAAVLQSIDGGNLWTRLVCLPGRQPRAIAARGGLVAAQVGDSVYVSADGAATWPTAPAK